MKIKRGFIYLADLNPKIGTEPGKVRPVLVLQTNLLNNIHPSTIVCPLTTKVEKKANYLLVHSWLNSYKAARGTEGRKYP
ncbi:MAG: hypothetical protein COS84_06800 [Armatimonadetes bacterium CG07_land_8_20_14_0_80_40_9]|nr:MAG: hypothetical protein COS84_06800 [Armatimonadetes bacterium CG07_land_8_20_14_0_80_40_9]